MSDPKDHHYLAQFYLAKWVGPDGLVCRYSRPHGDRVVRKRVSPRGTGFEEHLYSMRTPEAPPDAGMEQTFMSRLDSEAATALEQLEDGLPDSKWDPRLRSAWSRFVWAQSIRTPGEIAQLKSSVKEAWSAAIPELQQRYAELRPEGAPESVEEYLANLDPYDEDRFALGVARKSMDHSRIGQVLNNMRWRVIDFASCGIPLLTSDRPVWMTATFVEPDAFLLMPIGPTRLFVAAPQVSTLTRIAAQDRRKHAKNLNKLTVQHAVKLVFGIDDRDLAFVQKHFASRRHATHMERLAALRGHRIVANDSPAKKA